ncbi:unnamed protein product [marine sediment metagenome]|uniref:Uncharacterized protein n=1 Tax=marine sediment metagenome TaxID=412755 RepID=X0VJB1_9ZZZZ
MNVEISVEKKAMMIEFLKLSIHGGSMKNSLYQRKEKPFGGKLIISPDVKEITTTIIMGNRINIKTPHENNFKRRL